MGKPHKPNDLSRQMVKNMAKYLPKKYIAEYVGVSHVTLAKHYAEELKECAHLKMKLVQTAMEIALEDRNVTMLIFLLKTYVGLSEEQAQDAAEKMKAEPMEIKFEVAPAKGDVKVKRGK